MAGRAACCAQAGRRRPSNYQEVSWISNIILAAADIRRVQQLLRMAFGHAQLLLYRPFLHYVSQSYNVNTVDQRAFACASACVNVSRNIIHISTEMRNRGQLAGAYWFSMYTTFFAIVSILYFVLENPQSPTSFELLRDAVEGKDVLAYFAKRSLAADRCSTALKVSTALVSSD